MKSYGRFWRAWNRLSHRDSEEEKRLMVQNWTNGRTEHLSEMTQAEYDAACKELEAASGYDRELKRRRSICLRLMQGLQIDTSDWQRVNDFCRNPRISGKPFGRLSVEELESLSVKLRAIARKGGLVSEERSVKREERNINNQFILISKGSNGNKEKPN
ncbi:hypothetical protein [Prevotella sp.]|uniref:hypothetical protein n=1 Tax=Prevotella sp. TaxID=59823 RepID=UPI0027E29408|nr:hypothetical protein [Prevotella sp.]